MTRATCCQTQSSWLRVRSHASAHFPPVVAHDQRAVTELDMCVSISGVHSCGPAFVARNWHASVHLLRICRSMGRGIVGKQTYTASNLATGDSLAWAALRSDYPGEAEGSQGIYGGALQEPPADARGLLHCPGHLLHRPPGQGAGRSSCSLRHQRL
jgi:hypothetical protein